MNTSVSPPFLFNCEALLTCWKSHQMTKFQSHECEVIRACCQLLLVSFVGEHRSLQPEHIGVILAREVVTDIVLGTHK